MSDNPQTPTTPEQPTPSSSTTPPDDIKTASEASTVLTETPAAEPEDAFDPEKLTLPEGFEPNEQFDEFKNFAKEAGFKGSQVQKLVDFHTSAVKAAQDASTKAWNDIHTQWVDEIKADKELGPNLDTVKSTVAKLLDNQELTDPKFREALNFTGAGNNPAVVRTLYRWAQRLSEGSAVTGNPAARSGDGTLRNEQPARSIYGPSGPHSGGPNLGS